MTTTLEIPNETMKRVMDLTKARTPEEAVIKAVLDFSRERTLAEAVAKLGTFDDFMTAEPKH